jgi:uncharacterized protein (TIRG00374 family)
MQRRRRLFPIVRFLLAALAILLLSRLVRPAEVARAASLVAHTGWPLVLVLLPTAVAMFLDARGWQLILRTLGARVALPTMVELRLSVEAVVLALPGGALAGEALKLALLSRRAGVPLTTGGASTALTKACLIGAESIYLALGAVAAAAALSMGADPPSRLPILLAVVGSIITGLVSFALFLVLKEASWASAIGRWLGKLPSQRIRRWAEARSAGFEELDQAARGFFAAPLRARILCVIPFLLEWLTEAAETFLILRVLHVSVDFSSVMLLDGVGSLLRAMAFFVPAGLGAQDAAQIFMLRALGVGDAVTVGAALILIKRTKEVFWVVTGVLFLFVRKDLWRQATTAAPGHKV